MTYWREGNHEVDFVLQRGSTVVGIEVESGKRYPVKSGLEAFRKRFKPHRNLLVGADGISFYEFLSTPVTHWLKK